jgi:hypothetical protein
VADPHPPGRASVCTPSTPTPAFVHRFAPGAHSCTNRRAGLEGTFVHESESRFGQGGGTFVQGGPGERQERPHDRLHRLEVVALARSQDLGHDRRSGFCDRTLVVRFLRRLLELHFELVEEVERDLGPPHVQ